MIFFFLGISISADKFMESISIITAKTKTIIVEDVGKFLRRKRFKSLSGMKRWQT
jgi:hypothetical protein